MNCDWFNRCWLTFRKDWVNKKFSISDETVFMSSASQTESFHLSSWNEMKQKERFKWWFKWRWLIVAKWIDKVVVWKLIQFILLLYSFMFSFLSFISFKNKSNEISSKLNKKVNVKILIKENKNEKILLTNESFCSKMVGGKTT